MSHLVKGGNVLQAYYWAVTGASALRAAKIVSPHLVIKKRQAQILIDFYEKTDWKKGGSRKGHQGGSRPMPDEEFARRDDLWNEIRGLNARNYLERLPS